MESLDQLVRPFGVPILVERRVVAQRLADREAGVEVRMLGHITGAAQNGGHVVGHVLAQDADVATLGAEHAHDQTDGRGLAGAVRP